VEQFKETTLKKNQMTEDYVITQGDKPLDLHHFKDADVPSLVEEFAWKCEQEGRSHGAIIHGKGKGTIRELVHFSLSQNPKVYNIKLGSTSNPENWGMTTFEIRFPKK
jgi:DNA-nicking Smr family endonuclease